MTAPPPCHSVLMEPAKVRKVRLKQNIIMCSVIEVISNKPVNFRFFKIYWKNAKRISIARLPPKNGGEMMRKRNTSAIKLRKERVAVKVHHSNYLNYFVRSRIV